MTNPNEMQSLIKVVMTGSDLKLVQNDATNDFYILGVEDTATIIVSDLNCKVLLKQQVVGQELVSINSFRKGTYIARIITATTMVEKKLVKA